MKGGMEKSIGERADERSTTEMEADATKKEERSDEIEIRTVRMPHRSDEPQLRRA